MYRSYGKNKGGVSMAIPSCADREKCKGDLIKCGKAADICWYFIIAFVLLGIVSDAANITLGLESMTWFLLAIVVGLASIGPLIHWAVAWYLNSNK
jgi:hypothetical protein